MMQVWVSSARVRFSCRLPRRWTFCASGAAAAWRWRRPSGGGCFGALGAAATWSSRAALAAHSAPCSWPARPFRGPINPFSTRKYASLRYSLQKHAPAQSRPHTRDSNPSSRCTSGGGEETDFGGNRPQKLWKLQQVRNLKWKLHSNHMIELTSGHMIEDAVPRA